MEPDKDKYEPILHMIVGAIHGLTVEEVSKVLGYVLNESFVSCYRQAKNKESAKIYVKEFYKTQNNIFLDSIKMLEADECKIILN